MILLFVVNWNTYAAMNLKCGLIKSTRQHTDLCNNWNYHNNKYNGNMKSISASVSRPFIATVIQLLIVAYLAITRNQLDFLPLKLATSHQCVVLWVLIYQSVVILKLLFGFSLCCGCLWDNLKFYQVLVRSVKTRLHLPPWEEHLSDCKIATLQTLHV